MANAIMRHFDDSHLKDGPLKDCFKKFAALANDIENTIDNGPEKSAALRKLIEAKDCAMRATVEMLDKEA